MEQTGSGLDINEKSMQDAIPKHCPWYFELQPIMDDHHTTRPLLLDYADFNEEDNSKEGKDDINGDGDDSSDEIVVVDEEKDDSVNSCNKSTTKSVKGGGEKKKKRTKEKRPITLSKKKKVCTLFLFSLTICSSMFR